MCLEETKLCKRLNKVLKRESESNNILFPVDLSEEELRQREKQLLHKEEELQSLGEGLPSEEEGLQNKHEDEKHKKDEEVEM